MLKSESAVKDRILKRFNDEIAALERELKVELPKEIQRARELGDLRENAEYKAAKERQEIVNARIAMLKKRVGEISMINLDRIPHDRAGFGSTVHLRAESGDTVVYQLVMPEEADAEKGMISTSSPIGRAILNKEEGDEIKVDHAGRRPPVRAGQGHHHPRRRRRTNDPCSPILLSAARRSCCAAPVPTARTTRACCARCRRPASRSTSWPGRVSAQPPPRWPRSTAARRLWDADGIWRGARRAIAVPLEVAAARRRVAGRAPARDPRSFRSSCCPRRPAVVSDRTSSLAALFEAAVRRRWRSRRVIAIEARRLPARRTAAGAWWWRMLGAPVDAERRAACLRDAIWQLIRGGAHMARPGAAALGRRYAEVLAESLGQPGFRELMLVATDLDARRDVVGGAAAGAVPARVHRAAARPRAALGGDRPGGRRPRPRARLRRRRR